MAQELDSFVVQIQTVDNSKVIGTGFIIDIEGLIATCWHVLVKGGVDPSQIGTEIGIGLPGNNTSYSATILTGLQADDVAILKLNEILPFGWSPALLWTTEGIDGHLFKTKGYSKLGQYTGIRAEGKILGALEIEGSVIPKAPPLQLYSQHIDQGMSGSPVLDLETNRVVGMVSQVWVPPHGLKLRDTAFAVTTESLLACYPNIKLTPPTEQRNLTTYIEDIKQLLRLLDYRILDQIESEAGLFFKCEKFEKDNIIPVLVTVVEGEATSSDMERMNQLLLSVGITEGIILTTPRGE